MPARVSRPEAAARSTPFAIWAIGGITEHPGGIYATGRLLDGLRPLPGQSFLDIGCGTGYTACLLAGRYRACVTAADISSRSLLETRKRVMDRGFGVSIVGADAHRQPFAGALFDGVLCESVLVFCRASAVIAEMRRVLKPGGTVGFSELTFLRPPPARLVDLAARAMGIRPFQREEWEALLRASGFDDVISSVHGFSLREQLASHLVVDGARRYLAAVVAGVRDVAIRRAFFTKDMLAAAREFVPYVGYGVYLGR